MISNLVHSKIAKFKTEVQKISVRRLRSLTLANKNTPFKIWGSTLDGDTYSGREVFTFIGPARNGRQYAVGYNYNLDGYMIMYDMGKGDYRTFVYDNITKLELNNKTYKID
jgi:hypothetical protein